MLEKLVAKLQSAPDYIVPFLVILTILVFVHEMGHYLIARWNGVRVEVFSIGFGPELFGWNDRHGTRWKVSLVPLGGYVKMFGESEEGEEQTPASAKLRAEETAARYRARGLAPPSPEESFHVKRVGQRAAIVAAGPAANYLFALLVFTLLFVTVGQRVTPPSITSIVPGSAAEKAGLLPGDLILKIDGQSIARFEQIVGIVQLRPGVAMDFVVRRDGAERTLKVTPALKEQADVFGNVHRIGQIGVSHEGGSVMVRHGPIDAAAQAGRETWNLTWGTLTAIGQMIVGTRNADELGGPIRIAKFSGDVWRLDAGAILSFMAYLSISLGLINLFPVPMLDGGHLLFYAAEVVRGRPLGPRLQEYGFRIGLALVLGLLVFATWNDLVYLREVFKGLIT
jgi:regulator of sigma E protease